MKLFISQPMNGLTDEEIKDKRKEVVNHLERLMGKHLIEGDGEINVIDSFFEGAPHDKNPLWYLSRTLGLMSDADLVYFVKGWNEARGCRIEHECAVQYGIRLIEEC